MALFERDRLGPDYPDNSGRHILIDCIQCDYTSNKNNGQTVLKEKKIIIIILIMRTLSSLPFTSLN